MFTAADIDEVEHIVTTVKQLAFTRYTFIETIEHVTEEEEREYYRVVIHIAATDAYDALQVLTEKGLREYVQLITVIREAVEEK